MVNLNYYALQQEVYSKLSASTALMALINGVFDGVSQAIDFPYITIGDISARDVSNAEISGVDYRLNIHIWSREAGHKQTADIIDVLYALLHNGSLSVSGKTLVAMRIFSSEIKLENDGLTRHGILKLQIVLQG